ncbi:MAG: arginine--tRNA ligase [Myxococcota bacterium]|nr:arginine--tRNA ligase [Myxococcota bacterium]
MHRYEKALTRLVATTTHLNSDDIRPLIRVPEPDKGDLSIPCFPFAKRLKKNPAQIAGDIANGIGEDPHFISVEAAGPYLNARIDPKHIVQTIVPEIRALGDRFCTSDVGQDRYVVVDYSSPNIAKPLGFHHLRSTMIGNALIHIHQALGYRVFGVNFLGDWGKTFGLLAEAFARFGDRTALDQQGISYLLELYIQANKAVEAVSGFDDAARAMFRRQEAGDKAAIDLWQLIRDISIDEFQKIYRRLGVVFDAFEGESHYRDGMAGVIEKIEHAPGTRVDQGALVVDMPYGEGEAPLMLRKQDGATLYATRDIAAAIDRWQRFAFEKSLYVVGVEQRRHFDQLKRALSAMGCEWSDQMTHVHFGRVHGMSTRKGTVVFLEDVLNEARDRAREKMKQTAAERDIDLDAISEQVGIGGVVFGDLKNLRTSDYTFDWEEMLNPKGFTGTCVQYAHARCCSVLRKAGGISETNTPDLALLTHPEEIGLVKTLARLPGAVASAARELEPSRVARAVYDIAHAWNRYQQAGNADRSLRILSNDPAEKTARCALVDATRIGLKKGMALLGVPQPEAM